MALKKNTIAEIHKIIEPYVERVCHCGFSVIDGKNSGMAISGPRNSTAMTPMMTKTLESPHSIRAHEKANFTFD